MHATERIPRLLLALAVPWLLTLTCVHVWAGVCYAFCRFSQPETEQKMRRFLIRDFLPSPRFPRFVVEPRRVTRAGLVKRGHNAWGLVPLPMLLISVSHFEKWQFLLANTLFFQAGLLFAVSWYGRRCLRLLNLDSIGDEDVAADRSDPPGTRQPVPPAPSRWSLLCHRADRWWRQVKRRLWNQFSAWAGQ